MRPIAPALTLAACLTVCGCAAVPGILDALTRTGAGQALPGASAADLADVEARVRNLQRDVAPLVCPAPVVTSSAATAAELARALEDAATALRLARGAIVYASEHADAGTGEGGT